MADSGIERIEYGRLRLSCALAVQSLLSIHTVEVPGEHARGIFRVRLSGSGEVDTGNMDTPVMLRETDEAGNVKSEPLFCGRLERIEIACQEKYKEAVLTVVSGTSLLDQMEMRRVFQSASQTCTSIADRVTGGTENCAYILTEADQTLGSTLIQYEETDWQFLKRLVGRMGLPLVADSSYYFPRFYIGLPDGELRQLTDVREYDLYFDRKYYELCGRCQVEREDFICYDIKSGNNLSLGDCVVFGGKELLVSRKEMSMEGGEALFTYRLARKGYHTTPCEGNPDFTGISFMGSVVSTKGENVEVALEIDAGQAGGNSYPFAPATGNLMYSMPQSGTKVSLYIGSAEESGGMIAGCVRTNGATCEGTGTPSNKGFRNEYGKGMDLFPGSIGLTSGETGSLKLLDEEGIKLESTGLLMVHAKTGVRVEGETGISVQAVSDITAMALASSTSVLINGTMDMLGTGTALRGSMYQSFEPFDDAPVKGEFDWGGFFKNLLIGIAVTAVLAVAAVATGGILAAALAGAAIGAGMSTVTKAGEEWSSGNVRSTGETIRDLTISAISGAISGAVGAKFPGMNRIVEGLVDTGVSIFERGAYALFDSSMSWEEKLAYTFDPTQIAIDFVSGIIIGEAVDWVGSKINIGKPKGENGSGSLEAQIPRTGDEWEEYFKDVYGADNVVRESGPSNNRTGSGSWEAQIPRTGDEWEEYFKDVYGADNVVRRGGANFEDFDISNATNKQKGNFGEFKANDNLTFNQSLIDSGYDLKSIGRDAPTSPNDEIIKGIDGLYKNMDPNSQIQYVIDEAKFGSSQLGKTKDNLQMSDDWLKGTVTGNNRILDAVGGNKQLAKEIEDALDAGLVEKVLTRIDKNGVVTTFCLDIDGKIVGTWP